MVKQFYCDLGYYKIKIEDYKITFQFFNYKRLKDFVYMDMRTTHAHVNTGNIYRKFIYVQIYIHA